jgi:hypothetical protein
MRLDVVHHPAICPCPQRYRRYFRPVMSVLPHQRIQLRVKQSLVIFKLKDHKRGGNAAPACTPRSVPPIAESRQGNARSVIFRQASCCSNRRPSLTPRERAPRSTVGLESFSGRRSSYKDPITSGQSGRSGGLLVRRSRITVGLDSQRSNSTRLWGVERHPSGMRNTVVTAARRQVLRMKLSA